MREIARGAPGPWGCPTCGEPDSYVVDTRYKRGAIRRRRECPNGHRYTTAERVVAGKSRGLGTWANLMAEEVADRMLNFNRG